MVNYIKEIILKYQKEVISIGVGCLILGVIIFIGVNLGKENPSNSIISENTNVDSNAPIASYDNKVIEILDGTILSAEIPEDVVYKFLVSFIEENKIEGIKDVLVSVDKGGINLKAKYSLLSFLDIPAEFTLVPKSSGSLLTLSVENVKIMSLKINVDKIIEKWITANKELEDTVKYNNKQIEINISKIAPVNIEKISLNNKNIDLSIKINKNSLTK